MISGDQIRESVEAFDMQIFFHSSARFVELLSGKAGSDRVDLRRGRVAEAAVGPGLPAAASAVAPRGRELGEAKRQAAIARRQAKESETVAASPAGRRRG